VERVRDQLVSIVVGRLRRDAEKLRRQFQERRDVQTRYAIVDDVFPVEIAREIYESFPAVDAMRLLTSFREKKYTSKALEKMKPLIADAIFTFQAPDVIREVEAITGMNDLVGDPHLYAGGISSMVKGHFLNPHIDNSHDSHRKFYRALNLLYYPTPGWPADGGGNLELWDVGVRRRVEIPSSFNRLVIMETNSLSWHSVNEVRNDGTRQCVSNYYFSPHPPGGKEHFHITFFQARPEQHVRRLITLADSSIRTLLRRVVRRGVGKEDLYRGPLP
jgi:Rps23 Pro-64 3,4-dihydroxylase Tpa1-like proline 4-hydroxylase